MTTPSQMKPRGYRGIHTVYLNQVIKPKSLS